MTKNKTFLLNKSLACANYAIYVAINACIGYAKKAEKIGKVMMRRVANKYRKCNGKCILFIWLVSQIAAFGLIYIAAFSYIRNFYMGSIMDIARTVFTKAMFA